MEQMSVSLDSLMTRAWKTAIEHLDHAVEQVDHRFGEGFSKKNPELVVGILQASAIDLHGMLNAEALQKIADAVAQRDA